MFYKSSLVEDFDEHSLLWQSKADYDLIEEETDREKKKERMARFNLKSMADMYEDGWRIVDFLGQPTNANSLVVFERSVPLTTPNP